VASVIGGGLRARRAANLSQGLRASLRHVAILAAAMIVVEVPADLLSIIGHHIAAAPFPWGIDPVRPGLTPWSLLVVMALAAPWCGRRWPTVAAAGVAAAAMVAVSCRLVAGGWATTVAVEEIHAPVGLALMALVPLTRRAGRPPASLLWLPCLPLAVGFAEGLAAASRLSRYDSLPGSPFRVETLLSPYGTYLSLVPVLVAVCWLLTDVRPLAALALQSLLMRALSIAFDSQPGESRTQTVIVVGLLLLALTGALLWLLRHRARTAPPTIG
jgi:hypothetical protein